MRDLIIDRQFNSIKIFLLSTAIRLSTAKRIEHIKRNIQAKITSTKHLKRSQYIISKANTVLPIQITTYLIQIELV